MYVYYYVMDEYMKLESLKNGCNGTIVFTTYVWTNPAKQHSEKTNFDTHSNPKAKTFSHHVMPSIHAMVV